MSPVLISILCGVVIMLASLVGVITTWKRLGNWTARNLRYLVSFSAGLFFIVAMNLTGEALELSPTRSAAFLSLLGGAVGIFLLGRLIPESHHHHEMEDASDHHDKAGAQRILFGDAIHNLGDGLLLVPAFVIDIRLGITTAVGIFVHEAIQEFSEFFILKEGGYSTKQALARNFLVSGTILIGIALGLTVTASEQLIGPLLGIAAGAFFFIVLNDLIPRSVAVSQNRRDYVTHALAGLAGALLMIGLIAFSGHGHSGIDDYEEHGLQGLTIQTTL